MIRERREREERQGGDLQLIKLVSLSYATTDRYDRRC